MSVVQLDFYDREDINGDVIFTTTDTDEFFERFEMGIALRDLGLGQLTVSRQGVAQGSGFLYNIAQTEAFVRVLVPSISSDYLFGFFIDTRKQTVLSSDESAGRDIVISGPGPMYYLSRAILWHEKYAGSLATVDPVARIWRFGNNWTPGRVAQMLMLEDAANPITEYIPALTNDFDEDLDSNGDAWTDTFEEGLQIPIGAHYLQIVRILQAAAENLDAFVDVGAPGSPQMLLRMFNRYGRDLTGNTFGAGTVLWKAGIPGDPLSGNILTGLEQEGNATRKPSHVLVRGPEGKYQRVPRGAWVPGDFTKAVAVDHDNSMGDLSLFRFGRRFIQAWNDRGDALQLEIHPGFDVDLGHYMPGPEGSNGHFWIGDDITLKTGPEDAGVLDYDYSTERVTGIRMVVDIASLDTTDATAALSWHVVPELNESFGIEGDLNGGVGICCGPKLCQDEPAAREWTLPIEFLIKQRWEDTHADMYRTFAVRHRDGTAHPYFEVFWEFAGGDLGLAVKGLDQDSNNTGYDNAVDILSGVEGQDFITRFRIEQTEVMARFWFAGDPEPGTWQAVASGSGFSLTDPGVASLNRLEDLLNSQTPSPGTFTQDYIRILQGFGTVAVGDEFLTPVASDNWGISTINGAIWEVEESANAGVTGGEAFWTGAALETAVASQLIIPADELGATCIHGGLGATGGDSAMAASADHAHDYVAAGGATGEVLTKVSGADWDTEWVAAVAPSFVSLAKYLTD